MKFSEEDICQDPVMGRFLEFLDNLKIKHVQSSFEQNPYNQWNCSIDRESTTHSMEAITNSTKIHIQEN